MATVAKGMCMQPYKEASAAVTCMLCEKSLCQYAFQTVTRPRKHGKCRRHIISKSMTHTSGQDCPISLHKRITHISPAAKCNHLGSCHQSATSRIQTMPLSVRLQAWLSLAWPDWLTEADTAANCVILHTALGLAQPALLTCGECGAAAAA
jgi:hypothetical protein